MICEKPLAVTNKEAWDIVNICKKRGVKLAVGCDRRFWLQNQWTKQLVEEGVIGKVLQTRCGFHEHVDWYGGKIAKTDFRWSQEGTGGAAISDGGAHGIDLITWLVGSPIKRVVGLAKQMTFFDLCNVDDATWILAEHENGITTGLSINRFTHATSSYTALYGDQGTIFTATDGQNPFQSAPMAVYTNKDYELENMPDILKNYRWPEIFWGEDLIEHPVRKRWITLTPPRIPNSYTRMLQHYLDCIINDREPLVSGEDGARAIEVMCATWKSMETKAWVDLPLREEVMPPKFQKEPEED